MNGISGERCMMVMMCKLFFLIVLLIVLNLGYFFVRFIILSRATYLEIKKVIVVVIVVVVVMSNVFEYVLNNVLVDMVSGNVGIVKIFSATYFIKNNAYFVGSSDLM